MEAQYARILRHARHEEMVERPRPCAAALERAHKVVRPEVHFIEPDGMRHVCLFRSEDKRIHRNVGFAFEFLVDVVAFFAGIESETA